LTTFLQNTFNCTRKDVPPAESDDPQSLLHVGVHKPERQVAVAAEFHTVVLNIIDFLVWNSSGAFSFEVAYTFGVEICASLF